MPRCAFEYQSGDGQFTRRTIRDWTPSSSSDSIEAYCELRKEQRTFNIKKMTHLVDLETGEVVADPWTYFGIPNASGKAKERKSLDALTWEALPAIKALKFFAITTRGFSARERQQLIQFVQEVFDVSTYSKEELEEWLKKLWCGNAYDYRNGKTKEYADLLQTVPNTLIARCQQYALRIAKGSGRKEIDSFWLLRIESEFSESRQVPKPPAKPAEDEGPSFAISSD